MATREIDCEVDCKDYLPTDLHRVLFAFQKKGVLYGIRHGGRCLIGDQMGLGKTLQALSIAYYYRTEWPLLILTPSSMQYAWVEEIEKWLPEVEPAQINLIRGLNHVECISTATVTVVSYGLLSFGKQTFTQYLLRQQFQVVIVDESHYIKNGRAARSRTAVKLIRAAKRAILLSGTPAISRPSEVWC
jgi:SNF2 family DNA or RNA helicase